MPKIKEISTIIASREMEFRYEDGTTEVFFLRVGMPYEIDDGGDWICPYELGTESDRKLFGMFGIDSLQALELMMKILKVDIENWERVKKGQCFFLDEKGAGV